MQIMQIKEKKKITKTMDIIIIIKKILAKYQRKGIGFVIFAEI